METGDASQLIITTITRFGTVLFIVYTVSILLNVYRYVMRLAAYYDARADALWLMQTFEDGHAKRYQMLVDALNAEKIDFGKPPTTPLQHVIDLAKSIKK